MTKLDEKDLRLVREAVGFRIDSLSKHPDTDYDAYLRSLEFEKVRDKLEIMMMEL